MLKSDHRILKCMNMTFFVVEVIWWYSNANVFHCICAFFKGNEALLLFPLIADVMFLFCFQ